MDVQTYIAEQRHYFERGLTYPIEFRKKMLEQLKEAIQQREEHILEALQKDLGKSAFESYVTEIGFVLASIDYTIKHLDEWLEVETVKTPLYLQKATSSIVRDPYGVVLIIGPFNYPFQLVMEPLIGSIAGGNTTIVKPSEQAPETAKVVEHLLESIYPLQYVRVVQGAVKETDALIHADFDKIFFTGSQKVGKIVMKAAAERLVPVTLELGGKSPVIVDETAKIDIAAERIIWGKFTNVGQTCVAPDYVLVHESKAEALAKALEKVLVRFYGKDPQKSEDYGRIAQPHHWERLVSLLRETKGELFVGGAVDLEDLYIAPTIVTNVTQNDALMRDELFGPILPILTYETLEEAVHLISLREKPLAAYMFSEDERAIRYFTTYTQFGGGCINDTLSHVGNIHLPFGGVGPSGMGRYHGYANIETFTHAKSMMRKSTTIAPKIAYPPYKGKLPLVRSVLK